MSVNIEDYIVMVKGQKVIQFPGLLALAHEKGLKSMVSEIVDFSYGEYAVCKATVEFEDGTVFTSYGDAGVGNVSGSIAPHMLRMSETRAYGRALRNGLNIGEVAAEEMEGDSSGGGYSGNRSGGGSNRPKPKPAVLETNDKITESQLSTIRELSDFVYADSAEGKTGYEYFVDSYPGNISSIRSETADTLIEKMEAKKESLT